MALVGCLADAASWPAPIATVVVAQPCERAPTDLRKSADRKRRKSGIRRYAGKLRSAQQAKTTADMAKTIAIVEDEPAIRENYAGLFGRQGFHVDTYDERASASAALQVCPPDLATITPRIKGTRRKFLAVDAAFDAIEAVYGAGYRWLIQD
jgi:hypothetical protein